jgi:hypothetical protein
MPIQLKGDPQIRINGEELEGYNFLSFKMTKRLLEPNRMEFTLRKKDMTLTQEDIRFELRSKLLGALVECSVTANRRAVEGGWVTDEINDFFRGYIQHVNLVRGDNKDPMKIKCIAYSPDARLKMFPNCKSFFDDRRLDGLVQWVFQEYSEDSKKYDAAGGRYYNFGDDKKNLELEVNPRYKEVMPYIVQYHESDYDFLVRMAKRFGEFFYYENGKVVFGEMVESDPVNMRTGYDIESYDYDLNMSQHTGIVLTDYDKIISTPVGIGAEKGPERSYANQVEPTHDMAKTVYDSSNDFFNHPGNQVSDLLSAHINSQNVSINNGDLCGKEDPSGDHDGLVVYDRRRILDKYVMADTVICRGKARRADLKLGSVIVIEDETYLGWLEKTDIVQHEPLKVIDLTYVWDPENDSRTMSNEFKAIPQKSEVPPYLERDENGFLTYGDFDVFPQSGPQHGVVVDTDDPDKEGKVRVVLDWQLLYSDSCFSGKHSYDEAREMLFTTPFIRVAQTYAGGSSHGAYLIPEKGDEVIVGFEHNNVERPYVMASLYNTQVNFSAPEWTEDNKVPNEFKAIRTRNGHTIEIRDKGEHGYIKIYDNDTHNYVVTYDTDKRLIRLQSKGNIELVADKNIVLNAGNDVIVDAKNNIDSHAKNDIYRYAEHTIEDVADYDYRVFFKNNYHLFTECEDGNGTGINMWKDKGIITIDGFTEGISFDVNKGIKIHDQGDGTIFEVVSDNDLVLRGADSVRVESNMKADVKANQVNVNGDTDVNIKGGMVKIN